MERLLLFVDPKHCPAYNDPVDLLIATIIAISLFVCYVPQHFRIFNTKTSEGINPWFLLYGSVSITCNLFNILILQANKIYVSGRFCFQNTLGIIQIIIQWLMFTIFLILYMAYFPEHKKYISDMSGYNSLKSSIKWRVSRYVAVFVASHFIFTLIVSACLLIFVGKAEEHFITKFWAELLGVLSMIIASIQYLPQILETWEIKIVGALSIPMLIVQTPGTFLLVYFLAIREGYSWSTWIAFLIAGILQGILLALCIVWYYREKRGISPRSVSEIEAQSSESSEPNESSSLLDPQRVREN